MLKKPEISTKQFTPTIINTSSNSFATIVDVGCRNSSHDGNPKVAPTKWTPKTIIILNILNSSIRLLRTLFVIRTKLFD